MKIPANGSDEHLTVRIASGKDEGTLPTVQPAAATVALAEEIDSSRFIENTFSCIRAITKADETFTVSNWDIASTIISILFRIISIILNMLVAYEYYRQNKTNYFAWTTCCIVIPMVITSLMCIYMHFQDTSNNGKKKSNFIEILWFVIVFPFLFRYCQSLSYAVASKRAEKQKDEINQKRFYEFMIREESDVALIRIFECFLEAAPQKVLQISIILAGEDHITWRQFASISGCWVSLAWCMVVYHKYNRFSQPDKEKISIFGTVMQCLWHFFVTVSRVLCIAIIASLFPFWTLISCIVHALVMCLTIFCFDRPHFCSSTIFHSFAFTLLLGTVYIFTYIMPKDGRTRYRFAMYYTVCCCENILSVILFILYASDYLRENAFFLPLCVFSLLPFFIGIIFMILYYTQFHPNITARNKLRKKSMTTMENGGQRIGAAGVDGFCEAVATPFTEENHIS